jgi:hypothetical protein
LWSDSKCSCSYFLKNYFCYHLIALAVNEGLLEIPLAYKNIAIGAKPKHGRKPKAVVGGKKTVNRISIFYFLNNIRVHLNKLNKNQII